MTSPKPDELELSLFGPGVGECGVVHLGAGDWMIVDSCIEKGSKEPVAITYLRSLGVDVEEKVKLIVATHWHDDHIRGLSEIVKLASNAQFVCSAALNNVEFEAVLAASKKVWARKTSSGTKEFATILDDIQKRNLPSKFPRGPHRWAAEGKIIPRQSIGSPVQIMALSPSDQTVSAAFQTFNKLKPSSGQRARRCWQPRPNDMSVVLKIWTSDFSFLLGGDLEICSSPFSGWGALLANALSFTSGTSDAYKVAHHGSGNGDPPALWSTLLSVNAYALVTPYNSGKKALPSQKDISRLKSRTNNLYCTSLAAPSKSKKKGGSSAVDEVLKDLFVSRRPITKKMGHIRLRVPLNVASPQITVDLFGAAVKL